jgi:NTE family protein
MEKRWAQGLSDAQETIIAAPWLEPMPAELGARTFDVRAKGAIGDTSKNSLSNKAGG